MPPAPKRKRTTTGPRPVKIYNKDIICLPHQLGDNVLISIPRGEKRSRLAEMGLVGKIALHSVWQAAQVEAEVSSVFASAFGLSRGELLPYVYLRYDMQFVLFSLRNKGRVRQRPEIYLPSQAGCGGDNKCQMFLKLLMALFTSVSLQYNGGNQKIKRPKDVKLFSLERFRGCLAVLTGISLHNG